MKWINSSCLTVFSILLLVFSLCACSAVILSETDTIRLKDIIPPVITLLSPQDNGFYAASVQVTGIVSDWADNKGTPGQLATFDYKVEGTATGGKITPGADGHFQFTFSTGNREGIITLTLTAVDWNTMSTTLSITLKPGAFPDFRAVPGNGQVTLSWSPVPFAKSYSVYYTNDATLPSAVNNYGNKSGVSSPLLISGLPNGYLYSFIIQAHSGEGADNWSDVVKTIPLSPFTLAPVITESYRQIRVQWSAIKATDKFIVKRSLAKKGTYRNISGQLTGAGFTDTEVVPGTHYYYKILPTLEGCAESEPNSGQCSPFPVFPSFVSSFDTPFLAMDLELAGPYAYLAAGEAGLLIADVSDPYHPLFVGSLDTPGYAQALSVEGDYVYLAADAGGLQIIEVKNPALPRLTATLDTAGNALDVDVKEGYAYIAASGAGLMIARVSDPYHPAFAASFCIAGSKAEGITLDGSYAYIAYGESGLLVIDITDPLNPRAAGACPTPPHARKVAIAAGYAYVANGATGLQIINPADLRAPYSSYPTGGNAVGIAVAENLAFIADKVKGLIIVDISDKFFPAQAALYPSLKSVSAVAIRGRYAYLACYEEGMHILDMAHPAPLRKAGSFPAGDAVHGVTVQGELALLADNNAGLRILDLADPAYPCLTGELKLPGMARAVSVCGDYAFVTGIGTGLQIIHFQEPAHPRITGALAMAGTTTSAEIRGDFAYVTFRENTDSYANPAGGLVLVNIADPALPVQTGIYKAPDCSARSVTLLDGYACLMNQEAGISILSLPGSGNPQQVNVQDTGGSAFRMAITENIGFTANGAKGIWIANFLNPQVPLYPDKYPTTGCAQDIRLAGSYAFVADNPEGLLVLDIRDLRRPFKAGAYTPPDGAAVNTLFISGRYAFLAGGSSGLIIVDLWPYD